MCITKVQLIPEEWKTRVCEILKERKDGTIHITKRGWNEFESTFPTAFRYQLYDSIINALKSPDIQGRRVFGMTPPGEIYEFFFSHCQRKIYGKLCLPENGPFLLVIISAHRPLKGDSL